MNYTLSTAAKAAGVAKSTISKAIKDGSLSKVETVGNSYRIDPAELQRWMDVREKRSPNAQTEQPRTLVENPVTAVEKAALEQQIAMLQDQFDDMKKQRDSWQSQAEINTRLLEDHSRPVSLKERIFGKSKSAA